MNTKTVTYVSNLVHSFREEEDGLALTEYLILLGLLTGAVIVSVALFGTNLNTAWDAWATWIGGAIGTPPVIPE